MWFLRRAKLQHKFFWHNSCLIPKSKLPIQMYYLPYKLWTCGQNQCLSSSFKFWTWKHGFWLPSQNPLWLHRFEGLKLFLLLINMVQVSTDSQEKKFSESQIFSSQKWSKFAQKVRGQKNNVPPLSPDFWWHPQ